MSTLPLIISSLQSAQPTLVKLMLINMPPGTPVEHAENILLREINNFEIIISTRPELLECTPQSIVMAVKEVIANNLTLSPTAGLVYLYPGKVKTGMNGSTAIYTTVLQFEPTANGALSIARQSGRVLDCRMPTYKFTETGALLSVTVEFLVPSFPNPRWEALTYGQRDFEKWKQKSAAKFGGKANANYTALNGGIDPEFAASKAIKHGLKRRGTNMNEVFRMGAQSGNVLRVVSNMAAIAEVAEEHTPAQETPAATDTNANTNEIPDLT